MDREEKKISVAVIGSPLARPPSPLSYNRFIHAHQQFDWENGNAGEVRLTLISSILMNFSSVGTLFCCERGEIAYGDSH